MKREAGYPVCRAHRVVFANLALPLLLVICLLQQTAVAQRPALTASPVIRALEEEVKRAMDVYGKSSDLAPYFIGYEVNEIRSLSIEASRGAIRSNLTDHVRLLDIDV